MPTKLPCATGILLSLIVLLIVVAVPSSSLQVDEIWLSKTSDESLEIAYLVTSYTPEATDALLASFAKLHFTQFQTPEDNFLGKESQLCLWSNQSFYIENDGVGICPPPELADDPMYPFSQFSSRKRAREIYYRRARLWQLAKIQFPTVDYFVFLDAGWPSQSPEQLLAFQKFLKQARPTVAVPYHRCNTVVDAEETASITHPNSKMISSVFDTNFVAVHSKARNLLLPLHHSVLSLICHLMLRGQVMQIDLGIAADPDFQDSNCDAADITNQNAIINFVSSLKSKDYLLALPFSPRMKMAVLPQPDAVQFTGDGKIPSNPGDCPVDCGFNYWQSHAAFECCSLFVGTGYSYNAEANYLKMSQKWNLPQISSLAGQLMIHQNGYYGPNHGVQGYDIVIHFLPNAKHYYTKNITHELAHRPQSFQIILSGDLLILEHSDSGSSFNSLQHFRLTVIPESMALRGNTTGADFQIQVQLTLSASDVQGAEHNHCRIFAKINELKVGVSCNSMHSAFLFDTLDMNQQNIEQDVPWFYNPGFSWFEVASNARQDTLRTRSINVSMQTHCTDIVHVSVDASVTLQTFCPKTSRACVSRTMNATSQNVTHYSNHEKYRSTFITDTKPNDLFDKPAPLAHANIQASPRRLMSDFACAGPNRKWPYPDNASYLKAYGPDQQVKTPSSSMCLLRNVCWIKNRMVMFLPVIFSHLPDFLDVSHVFFGEYYENQPDLTKLKLDFVFDSHIPADSRFAANITHYVMYRHCKTGVAGNTFNFGHAIWEDLGGVFHAMHLFDLPRDDGRVIFTNSHHINRNQQFLFPRIPVYIDEYPDGTCFEKMVVGFRGIRCEALMPFVNVDFF